MSATDSKAEGIAKVYGDVLLELANESSAADSLLEELTEFSSYLDTDKAFASYMESTQVDSDQRALVLEKTMRGKASDLMVNALLVINRKGRTIILRDIIHAFFNAYEQMKDRVDVHVTTAVPLSDELREVLKTAASKFTGKSAKLVEDTDASLLGGLVVRIGDLKLDSSLVNHLRLMRASLEELGMRAIDGSNEQQFIAEG